MPNLFGNQPEFFSSIIVGNDDTMPESTVALLEATSKGVVISRMSTSTRNAIVSPATGLIVFDTDMLEYYVYNGTTWAAIGQSTAPTSIPSGRAATAGLGLAVQSSTGLYGAIGSFSVTVAGTNRATFDSTGLTVNGKVVIGGYSGAGLVFSPYTTTGWYSDSLDTWKFLSANNLLLTLAPGQGGINGSWATNALTATTITPSSYINLTNGGSTAAPNFRIGSSSSTTGISAVESTRISLSVGAAEKFTAGTTYNDSKQPILTSSGAASLPSYGFYSSSSTGMYSSASNTIDFSNNSTKSLTIDSSGNLIGQIAAAGLSIGKQSAPVASAIAEFTSTSRGLLFPSMTTSQKDSISSPATGLVVYDTDLSTLSNRSTTKQGCPVSLRIANLVLTSNVVTVTLYASNPMSVGDTFVCIGLTHGSWTFINYKYLTVSGVSGSDITASYINANVARTAITVGTINAVHLYNAAAATWNSLCNGSTRCIYYDNFQAINTLTWSRGGTINHAVGIISSDSVDGRQVTWKSAQTFAPGNYLLTCGMQGFTDKGLVTVVVSQDNGSTYPITLVSGLNQYTNALYYMQYPLMFFTITSSCTPWINWLGQGKMSVSSSYSYTIMAPFVIYQIS